jgi:hypothetical protein
VDRPVVFNLRVLIGLVSARSDDDPAVHANGIMQDAIVVDAARDVADGQSDPFFPMLTFAVRSSTVSLASFPPNLCTPSPSPKLTIYSGNQRLVVHTRRKDGVYEALILLR